jgi:hypothetical protein
MFFGKKKKYREKVSKLLDILGLPLSEMGVLLPLNSMVEQSRLQGFTEHEAALIFAYSCMPKLAQRNPSSAMSKYYEITAIAEEWVKHLNVDESYVDQWSGIALKELINAGGQ